MQGQQRRLLSHPGRPCGPDSRQRLHGVWGFRMGLCKRFWHVQRLRGEPLCLLQSLGLLVINRDAEIARHVEALVSLGWRWEGRGLVPGGAWPITAAAPEADVMKTQSREAS